MKKVIFLLFASFILNNILLIGASKGNLSSASDSIFENSNYTYQYKPYRKDIKPTKNLIVMIADGTSISIVSAARWFKIYNNMGESLNIDPYICGTVKTHASNSIIGDSAPTMSCYMTGMPQQNSAISIYPVSDVGKDLVKINPDMAYQPLATLLEAAKIEQNKATGLVVTCEFPNATPAACAAHHYNRHDYKTLAKQMANQNLDIMFGGGNMYVTDDMNTHLKNNNIRYIKDDILAFRLLNKGKVWALFCDTDTPYDLDRKSQIPSLEEMTTKAIDILQQNENGFFLMVEGSKIDWAAHNNDAIGCITEFIAFDNAVKVALDFAKKDGNTTVIIMSDHGTGGFSIGSDNLKGYDNATLDRFLEHLSKYKKTGEALTEIIIQENSNNLKTIIKQYTDIEITDDEYNKLITLKNNYIEKNRDKKSFSKLRDYIIKIMNSKTFVGFTTTKHTGDEVFLAAFNPNGDIPIGMNRNIEINHYLSDILGLQTKLPELTSKIFAKHQEVFAGYETEIDKSGDFPVLIVKNNEKMLTIPANKSVAFVNGQPFDIGSVTVYIDKTDTFYLSEKLVELVK